MSGVILLFLVHFLTLTSVIVTAKTGRKKRNNSRKQRRRQVYTRSEKNAIIDATIHPLADQYWGFVIVDGALHALNEQDPIESFVKFLRYNAPELLKRIIKEMT